MDNEEVKNRLREVFCEVFKLDEKEFDEAEANIHNMDEWDSLSHVTLILQIEKTFGCKVPKEQIVKLDSFEKISDYLISACK